MSRMSSPTPIYNIMRSEDLANLNRILLQLAVDERARILTMNKVTLVRGSGSSSTAVNANVSMNFSSYVIAFLTTDNINFKQIPYFNISTGASLGFSEAVVMSNITNSAGISTITFTAYANDSVKGNTSTYYIYYMVLKDKIIPTN